MRKRIFFLVLITLFSFASIVLADGTPDGICPLLANETETILLYDPPDGNDDWYTYIPLISFYNPFMNSSDPDCGFNVTFYRWDSNEQLELNMNNLTVLPDQVYAGPINGTEDPATGGISTLHYHTEDSGGNTEPDRVFTSKVDFTPPSILDVTPVPDSLVYEDGVSVYAYLEEFYNGNSGINDSTVVLQLDGVDVPFSVIMNGIDAEVFAHPGGVSSGNHTLYLSVEDNAGNFAEREWSFKYTLNPVYSLVVESPSEDVYGTRRVLVNVSVDGQVSMLEYSDNNRNFVRLCKDCTHAEKLVSFYDGYHTVVFRATAGSEQFTETVEFLVDTKLPKIVKVLPSKFTTGNFSVTYTEVNLEDVKLYWKLSESEGYNEVVLDGCTSGVLQTCSTLVDFSYLDKAVMVDYYFVVSDSLSSVASKVFTVSVDVVPPEITVNDPDNVTYSKKSIPMEIEVSEDVKLYYSADGKRFRSLCMRCSFYKRPKPFSDGKHNITFMAVDPAGNTDEAYVEFEVDSTRPRIKRTYPDKITNGTFWVVYTEKDLQSAKLFVDGHEEDLDCESGSNVVCSISLDLSDYDGMLISYYFRLSDKVTTVTSKLRSVYVDLETEKNFEVDDRTGISPQM